MAIESAPDIEKVVREGHAAYQRGDAAAIKESWSKDKSVSLFGSAPDERWDGYATITEGLGEDMSQRSEESRRSRLESVHAWREGDIGWAVVETVAIVGEDEVRTRGTAVLHREDAQWKFVQWTFSVLVPNDVFEPGSALLARVAVGR